VVFEFLKANATSLSPECRDLMDKIFIADEFKRITLQVGTGFEVVLYHWLGLGTVCSDLQDKIASLHRRQGSNASRCRWARVSGVEC
jgi:hypothetical protein